MKKIKLSWTWFFVSLIFWIGFGCFIVSDFVMVNINSEQIQNKVDVDLSSIDERLLDCPRHILLAEEPALVLRLVKSNGVAFYSLITKDIMVFYDNHYVNLYHELGHCVWYALDDDVVNFKKNFKSFHEGSLRFPTVYSKTNVQEDFAESFMCYMTQDEWCELDGIREIFVELALEEYYENYENKTKGDD